MDENFEDIILDEEDDLNFGVESLREKTKSSRRDNTTGQNLNKDVMSLITNEEHLKPYKNTSSNQNLKKYTEEDEKELSEEYNDFEYNIEDNESGNKSQEKLDINNNNNEHQKTPFVIDENNDLYGSSSGSNDRIENNVKSPGRNKKGKNMVKDNNNNVNNIIQKDEIINNESNNNQIENELQNNLYNINENNANENINDMNMNYAALKEENEKLSENENQNVEINKEKELVKNSSSMIQMIEDNYYVTKNELENILSKLEFNNVKEITKQNIQLIDYISKLNTIVNAIIKIFPKGEILLSEKISKNKKIDKEKETKEEKEKKIVGIYRREYLRLENKYQLIKDPVYKESLIIQLNKLQKEYEQLYEENNILREEQRKNELSIERKARNSSKEQSEVKRIEMDIDNIKSQINLLQKKVGKNKTTIIENNKRINQYVEREKNLDYIAKEKYGIKEYEDIYVNQENKMKMIEDKNNLIRKIEIYEKGIETNKNKYEREIKENEFIINDLENEKINLIYHYKELIGDEQFQNLIQNIKKDNKYNIEISKGKNKDKKVKENEKEDIKNEEESIKINIDDKDENLLLLKDNNNIQSKNEEKIVNINNLNNVNNNQNNLKKYPEFLDFFKDDENEGINEIDSNRENIEEMKEDDNDDINKDEKEIKIAKFEELNSLSNKEKEDESPPNEYEDLEEFQI
jgi:hypothetical protein